MRRGVRLAPLPASTLVPNGFQGELSIEQELSRGSQGNSGRNPGGRPGGRPGELRGSRQSAPPASPRVRWYRTGSRGNSQGSCRYPGKCRGKTRGSAGGLGSRPLPPPREYGSAEPATVGLPVDGRRGVELPGGTPGAEAREEPLSGEPEGLDAVEAVRASGWKLPADGGRGRGDGRDPRGD